MTTTTLPHVNVTIDKKDVMTGLTSLMSTIRPKWTQLQTTKFTDGLTNDLYGVYEGEILADDQIPDDRELLLVRLFGSGTEFVIDRELEQRTVTLLSKYGSCQPIHATFQNGVCYGFQRGTVLSEDEMRSDEFSPLIAREAARLHTIPVPENYAHDMTKSHMFQGIPAIIQILPERIEDEQKNERYQRIRSMLSPDEMVKAAQEMEKMTVELGQPLTICHHDLLNRNLVYSKPDQRVFFIDYEFAGLSYAPIDLAGHFLAYVGITNPDFKHFPSEEQQARFIRTYLEERKRLTKQTYDVTDEDVGRWVRMVNKMQLVNYLFWGLFCLVQECLIDIEYHAFLDGAEMLIGAFCQYREQLMAL